MRAFKLVRKLKNGEFAPLFINQRFRFNKDKWLNAEFYPTNGFKERMGWHCCFEPIAPHLSKKNRTWLEIEVDDWETYARPESQGGA